MQRISNERQSLHSRIGAADTRDPHVPARNARQIIASTDPGAVRLLDHPAARLLSSLLAPADHHK